MAATPPADAEYRLLVEHSPIMIWRAAPDGACDYFNATWLSFTGRTLEQELGSGWADGVHPDDLERCLSRYFDHLHQRKPFEMEYRLRRHDGVYRWIFDRGVPLIVNNGQFAGFIGSCVDVDERRKAQEAQEHHTQQQLGLAQDFERWILAIVSHDIRDPLNSIHLATQSLRLSDADGLVKRHADIIERGVTRIQHIVGDLLDLSREREGPGIQIEPKPTDLQNICRRIIDEIGATSGRSITLECEADGQGEWDEHRLLQAISNLASNAVQHGMPKAPVRIRLTGDEQRAAVEIHNEGIIAPDVLPTLFEPFRSGRDRTRRGGGLGLGLFIARAVARAHGGELEVESSRGNTMFRLVLPRLRH